MTYTKRSIVRNANGKVGEDGQRTIELGRFRGQVVRDFMDSQEEVLVGSSADDVGGQEKGPGKEGRVAKKIGAEDL